MDSFYDNVNARKYGSLGNDDGVTETMCNAFFDAHRDAEAGITIVSLQDEIASKETYHHGNIQNEKDVNVSSLEETHTEKVRSASVIIERAEEELQNSKDIQDENTPESSVGSKTTENLEDLTRLAMFGKQKTVLRRSQIKEPPAAAPSPVPSALAARALHRSSPRTITKRTALISPVVNVGSAKPHSDHAAIITNIRSGISSKSNIAQVTAVPIYQAAEAGKRPGALLPNRSPFLKANRVTRPAALNPGGPITRARSRDLSSRLANECVLQKSPSKKVRGSPAESVEKGVCQLKSSLERISRNRAPRTTTSSRSSYLSRPTNPVRIPHESAQNRNAFLRNEAVPSAREFHQELLHRNSSLGSSHRSASTPKDNQKKVVATSKANSAGSTSNKDVGVTSVWQPPVRASSVTRPEVVNRPAPRAASASRASTVPRPPSVVSRPTARSSRAVRPPSATRPKIPTPVLDGHKVTRSGTLPSSARLSAVRGPIAISDSGRNMDAMRAVPVVSRPSEPRSSVIRNPPSNKGPGDGTPIRGFRSELRRYPAPTGLTPLHRHSTISAKVDFHPTHGHSCTSSHGSPVVAKGSSPAKVLSKQEVRAMVNRLSAPKRTTGSTPMKLTNQQTHGLRCVKIRSRSTSLARRPLSVEELRGPICSGALQFGDDINLLLTSGDNAEENIAAQEARDV